MEFKSQQTVKLRSTYEQQRAAFVFANSCGRCWFAVLFVSLSKWDCNRIAGCTERPRNVLRPH